MQSSTPTAEDIGFKDLPKAWVRAVALGVTVVLLAGSVPILWAAVSGGLGLLALTLISLGGIVLFQAMPWAMQRLENRLLRMRKAEASANPIEQLENDVLRRAERLTAFRIALATVGGQIESIRQMVDESRHRDPRHVLERQQRALQRLMDFHGANLVRLDQAQAALEQFKSTVALKKSEWTIAQAIHRAARLLDPDAAQTLIEDLLTDEALRTVQDRFNTVFAELDIQMRGVDAPTRPLARMEHLGLLQPSSLPQTAVGRTLP